MNLNFCVIKGLESSILIQFENQKEGRENKGL